MRNWFEEWVTAGIITYRKDQITLLLKNQLQTLEINDEMILNLRGAACLQIFFGQRREGEADW
jgi:hypothetical protein